MNITVIYTIPKSQFVMLFQGKEIPKLQNSYILGTNGTRICCEAMVSSVQEIKDAYYDEEIMGIWKQDGQQVKEYFLRDKEDPISIEFDVEAYYVYIPDNIIYDEEGNEISRNKPLWVFGWAGWEEKNV